MEETRDDAGPAERGHSSATWWPSDFMEKFGSVSLVSQEETLNNKDSNCDIERDVLSPQTASQILWSTGMFSGPIPNGFYSVIPERRLKELYDRIPTLDELYALGSEVLRADIILVDAEKDKKLTMLRQLIVALVRGLSSNPATMIKKIAGLVSDFYKRPNAESPAKAALEESAHMSENRVVQMLGQIKHGSCRPRAILFKVLADTVGLESRLMVGLPNDGVTECMDSYRHMSVIVVLNSVELLVDLMRYPGQLIPRSTKAIFMTHISAAGESDSAENDSCDSPLEPNSPLYGFSEKADPDSVDRDDGLQYQRKLEASSNISGPALRNIMLRPGSSIDRKLSLSHSEPDIATAFWRRSRRKVIAEQRTASSSPEHPSFRARGRSLLSGDRKSFRDYSDDIATSRYRSDGTSDARRIRRRSISITPEISDDIVRAVRAMNETLKQNRLLREQGDDRPFSYSANDRNSNSDLQKNVSDFHLDRHDEISGARSAIYTPRDQVSSQKALSLPSSPHDFRGQASGRSGTSDRVANEEMVSTWNRVLESLLFNDKPLLPFQEWNIDFSELTVGTRVGIGFFGEVFRGIWNGTDVAIKVFLEQDLTAENMEDFCNEISILSRLRHPNVILFLGACTKPPRLSMVTEYMELGSLYNLIHLSGQKKKLSWRRRLKMLRDICRGLMCIHRMKIVHRDLKTANCLVNKHSTVKICDFGLSRVMTDAPLRDSSSAGTPEWMAPELIRNEPFSEKCDIFSLGVIMWELCTLNRPWEGVPQERVVYAVAHEGSRLDIPEGPLGRLIADCWAEPQERPSCEEILSRLLDCEYSLC
ncbi:probable serine/threonine-protein kinase SIS8 isoform X1 [Malania oleifera]|uniref:probable serine/threonine-protein kinase SIS8 isoform X1 n=1 Tax=Malania oleifera TaxID=397392 RepID=UPI0025AE9E1A|nr:probable serine/threonine-protein kinase SIS8 isoform X1 [Malania oleifera]XP_057953378.1 probable serine/threonine-protein kinase SIS8 isoform X1 [Malania oleifera]XP_057953379.1 probable serine/threonine-protein kinase SIS8 isoform X1 [Malania oleifera]XP_057953380.1 probable serine/threonine-protein kinase SIS8 isoform X1 [Malania oleifera]